LKKAYKYQTDIQVFYGMPSKCDTLSSNPSTTKEKKRDSTGEGMERIIYIVEIHQSEEI
jgi:hypothetical protein